MNDPETSAFAQSATAGASAILSPWRLQLLKAPSLAAAALLACAVPFAVYSLQQGQQPMAGGGASTGGVHAAIYDAQHRPITAGGFVKTGPVVFEDDSRKSGLASWTHEMGSSEKKYIIEANGSGVCLLDYNNDGWLDIYLVNGSTYDAMSGKATPPHAALFRNNHDGTFTNVAEQAGVTNNRWGFGCAVGDYNNDGWPDIYVTNFGKNRLYRNNHNGTFTDVAEQAGVALGNWSTGATFGDYDGDGFLDLFVPGYVHYDFAHPPIPGSSSVSFASCNFRGVPVMCGPRGLTGEEDHLFHNNGNGTFTDVSVKAGVSDPSRFYGFSAVFADLNNNGKVDLAVADDSTPNYLYINNGNGTFTDESYASGFALNGDGREIASMGLAVGDYDNTGWDSLFVTDFSDDYDVLYHNDGDANFSDVSYRMGIAEDTIPFLGWGCGFIDYDNDGWKDLFVANGHVYKAVDLHEWGTSYAERPLLFHNDHGKRFTLVPAVENTGLAIVAASRGAAFGDLFNNGKIDVVINPLSGHAILLRNVDPDHNHWVELKLIGGPRGPRDAVGATVYLTAGGIRQRGDVLSGGSYMSSNDQRVHFGLGSATTVDKLVIRWPGGDVESVHLPAVDRIFTITQDKGITRVLCVAYTAGKPAGGR